MHLTTLLRAAALSLAITPVALADTFVFTAIPDQDETRLRARFDQVATCYREARQRIDDLEGEIILMIRWDGEGDVQGAMCAKQQRLITDRDLCSCLERRAKDWRMPASDRGMGHAHYTFELKP